MLQVIAYLFRHTYPAGSPYGSVSFPQSLLIISIKMHVYNVNSCYDE